ncbi:hypothetical protein [Roseibacillus ishigakijimensis]|uniref:Uncharacterized protein n=2 Tax=Roseibacillus ishigakijimensis TaxID=454146 RepID=A0A934VN68_9BACT|nr:hypothetical protein [Roseibacillus ishigakijimensis]
MLFTVRGLLFFALAILPVALLAGWFHLSAGFAPAAVAERIAWLLLVTLTMWSFLAAWVFSVRGMATLIACFLVLSLMQMTWDQMGLRALAYPWLDPYGRQMDRASFVALLTATVLMVGAAGWMRRRSSPIQVVSWTLIVLCGWVAEALFLEWRPFFRFPEKEVQALRIEVEERESPGFGSETLVRGRFVLEEPLAPGEVLGWTLYREPRLEHGSRVLEETRLPLLSQGLLTSLERNPARFLVASGTPSFRWLLAQNEETLGAGSFLPQQNPSYFPGNERFDSRVIFTGALPEGAEQARFSGDYLVSAFSYREVARWSAWQSHQEVSDDFQLKYRPDASLEKRLHGGKLHLQVLLRGPHRLNFGEGEWQLMLHFPEQKKNLPAEITHSMSSGAGLTAGVVRREMKISFPLNWRLQELLEQKNLELSLHRLHARPVGRVRVEGTGALERSRRAEVLAVASKPNAQLAQLLWENRPSRKRSSWRETAHWLFQSNLSTGHYWFREDSPRVQEGQRAFARFPERMMQADEVFPHAFEFAAALKEGLPEENRSLLWERLADLEEAPGIAMERGWGEEALPEVERLIAAGHTTDELLRLGVTLGSELALEAALKQIEIGASEALLVALGRAEGRSERLWQAIEASIPGAVARTEERVLARAFLEFDPAFAGALFLGHEAMFAALCELCQSAREVGIGGVMTLSDRSVSTAFSYPEEMSFDQFQEALVPGNFRWDEVRELWIYQKGEMK